MTVRDVVNPLYPSVDQKRTHTFKSLFNVHSLLGASFKVRNPALRLAESHSPLRRDHTLVLLHIDLVSQDHLELYQPTAPPKVQLDSQKESSQDLVG